MNIMKPRHIPCRFTVWDWTSWEQTCGASQQETSFVAQELRDGIGYNHQQKSADDKRVVYGSPAYRWPVFFHKLKYSVWCRRRSQPTYAACVCWLQKQRCVLLPIAVRHSSTRPPPWEAEPSLPARPLPEGLALLLCTQSGVSLHTICKRLPLLLFLTLAWLREHSPPRLKIFVVFSSLSI